MTHCKHQMTSALKTSDNTQLQNVKKASSLWNATFYTTSHTNEARLCENPG